MKRFIRLILISFCCVALFAPAHIAAQSIAAPPKQITFNSFTGIYYLSRDSRGLSRLTSEETIVADFPGNDYGISRSLPKKFENHPVNIKILNVSDAAGNPVPYKTATDSHDNLVITTGDPGIILYGSQTIKIRYQTSGVINLNNKADEFLFVINGRDWDQPFGRVDATLYVPASFGASIRENPVCYTALGAENSNNCRLNVQKTSQNTIISSRAGPVAPHQTLILKLDFAPQTFTNNHSRLSLPLLAAALLAIFIVSITTLRVRKTRKSPT